MLSQKGKSGEILHNHSAPFMREIPVTMRAGLNEFAPSALIFSGERENSGNGR